MIDLRDKDREEICRIAVQVFAPGTEIWAYGSRVKGTNHDTSDLDLVVHFPSGQSKDQDLSQLSAFLERLRDSNIPIVVQALAWHCIPDSFRDTIKACYQVLWAARGEKYR
ncbi:nucleotidyltransferase domain-containing protein [Sansalvadorimonas sp. 2012CJ34-2]|uniref:Nucleotidyltransferase domain-containing protein n=1 Tax=Parendozoicomonas callyspongiae TaxID=2942213 RepID=A0ABT0PJY6_9GAMM|nr:nucleotidyltransferase domain-containing protein [Sansalvadorimonas sp. 2012CJ34-2]MCL6270778.1 nucleotidyltransferase domain-containing protein [Sansalvadorimonas sp. 2012CJ34-2]